MMRDLFTSRQIEELRKTLDQFRIRADLELERLEAFPAVLENLKTRKVRIEDPD